MDAGGFIKEHVELFKDFSAERIKELVDDSVVRSFIYLNGQQLKGKKL